MPATSWSSTSPRDAAAFAHTDEADLQGSSTPIDWIRHNCRMGGHAAADRVCVGEQLYRLPESARATSEGLIGYAHLSLIASTTRAITQSDPCQPFDEQPLLEGALEHSVGRFRYLCHHLRHAQDAEGLAAEQKAAHEARRLELVSCEDGSLAIRGLLDPAGGAALRTALEPLARRRGKDDDRPRQRRLGDGIVELATHALDTGRVPRQGSQRAHLQVTTTLETLLGKAGAPAAEMEFSLPISTRTVERLACDCNVTRVLLDADSTVIDVGRSSAWSRARPGRRSTSATGTASGPRAATGRPRGARRTTSSVGCAVAAPIWPIRPCSVQPTTGGSMRVAGR